jgi:uncharacterized membrane protein
MTRTAAGDSVLPILKNKLRRVRTALWFRPTAYCIIAAVEAVFIATVDGFLPRDALAWLPAAEEGTVQELLKLMAGSMLTVATVTLSVLMLVLSLAAGQASPRAVPEIMADPVTQNALGTFLATFVFSLTALLLFGFGAVAGPGVTLTFVFALLFVMNSLRYLVQWIHHVANALKVNRMIDRIFRQAETVLTTYLESSPPEGDAEVAEIAGPEASLTPDDSGYVQLIDSGKLHELARDLELSVKLCIQEGDFVHPNRRMMELRGKAPDETGEQALRSTVVVGFERSHESDPRLGFELLAEVACRALSPGINDPQTALASIAYLGALLSLAARRGKDDYPSIRSSDGRVEFLRPDFSALLERALRPVIRDGAGSAEVICEIVRILGDLVRVAAPDHLDAILDEAQRAEEMGMAALTLEADKAALGRSLKDLRHFAASRGAA